MRAQSGRFPGWEKRCPEPTTRRPVLRLRAPETQHDEDETRIQAGLVSLRLGKGPAVLGGDQTRIRAAARP